MLTTKWNEVKSIVKKIIIYNIEIEMKSVHRIESSNIIMYHHVVLFRCLWVLKKPLLFPFAHNDFICAWRAILYQFPSSLTIIFVTFMLVYFHFLQTSMLFFPQKNYKKNFVQVLFLCSICYQHFIITITLFYIFVKNEKKSNCWKKWKGRKKILNRLKKIGGVS